MKNILIILIISIIQISCSTTNKNLFKKHYNGYKILEIYDWDMLIQDTLTGNTKEIYNISQYYLNKYNTIGQVINE